jgi:GT2 family glycosyltransferase
MSAAPLLSYIVLSYNYERYIGKTLQSILDQTVQDFEIVVVDDKSSDGSVAVVAAVGDPRIRLFVNEKNIGGAASYNRAVQEARGEWLVNLDADDWIDPRKAEVQLRAASLDPRLDIIGTYVAIHDENDAPHPLAEALEGVANQPRDLNLVDSWIGSNALCRSSTMVRTSAHRRIGLDDSAMVRAPDYELWTRALRMGCRFAVIQEQLTFMRVHSRGVTHADPTGTLLEMSYAMQRNLVPLAEARSLFPSITRMVAWAGRHAALCRLPPPQAHRLIGILMQSTTVDDFSHFLALLADNSSRPELAGVGQRGLTFLGPGADARQDVVKLLGDVKAYIEARDYFRSESEKFLGDVNAYIEARDYFRGESEKWEQQYCSLEASYRALVQSNAQTQTFGETPLRARAHARRLRSLTRRVWSRLLGGPAE